METPLIIQYTNLLHKHKNPNAKAIKDFKEHYSEDEVFLKRAKILDALYAMHKLSG